MLSNTFVSQVHEYHDRLVVLLDMETMMRIGVVVVGVGNKTRALSDGKILKNLNDFTEALEKNTATRNIRPLHVNFGGVKSFLGCMGQSIFG